MAIFDSIAFPIESGNAGKKSSPVNFSTESMETANLLRGDWMIPWLRCVSELT